MMKKLLSILIIGAMLSTSLPAHADPPTPALAAEQSSGAAVAPMKKGQIAPFTGVLLTPEAVATVTVELNTVAEKIKIAVERAQEEAAAQCTAQVNEVDIKATTDKKVLEANLEAQIKENEVLADRLKKAEKKGPPTMFWFGTGAAAGVLTTVLIIVVANNN